MKNRPANILAIPDAGPDELVQQLGIAHRHKYALQRLMRLAEEASDAVRAGLLDENMMIRVGCCKVLDHHLDEAALPLLIENLEHQSAEVRLWAIHALACDRCKVGSCRPGEAEVIPRAVKMLRHDNNRQVRQMVAGLLGPGVQRSPEAASALQYAHLHDPHPSVRKVAGWWLPGGSRWQETQ